MTASTESDSASRSHAPTVGRRSRACSSTPTSRSSAGPGPVPRSGPRASTCSTPPSTAACARVSSCCSAATRVRARRRSPCRWCATRSSRAGTAWCSPSSTPPRAWCSASSRSRRRRRPSRPGSTRRRRRRAHGALGVRGRGPRPPRARRRAGRASPSASRRSPPCSGMPPGCRCTSPARTPPRRDRPDRRGGHRGGRESPRSCSSTTSRRCRSTGYAGDETSRVTIVTETMKDMSLELECPIVCISAADREALGSGHRMRTRDLRGSSALAYEADLVLILSSKENIVSREHLVYDLGSLKRFRRWAVITIEKNRTARAGRARGAEGLRARPVPPPGAGRHRAPHRGARLHHLTRCRRREVAMPSRPRRRPAGGRRPGRGAWSCAGAGAHLRRRRHRW